MSRADLCRIIPMLAVTLAAASPAGLKIHPRRNRPRRRKALTRRGKAQSALHDLQGNDLHRRAVGQRWLSGLHRRNQPAMQQGCHAGKQRGRARLAGDRTGRNPRRTPRRVFQATGNRSTAGKGRLLPDAATIRHADQRRQKASWQKAGKSIDDAFVTHETRRQSGLGRSRRLRSCRLAGRQ